MTMIVRMAALGLLGACAVLLPPSMPTQEGKAEWGQNFPLGKNKAEADEHFALRNNETGRWESALESSELSNEGPRSRYRYHWVRNTSYSARNIFYYDLTFVGDKLIKVEVIDPERFSEMGNSQQRTSSPSESNTGMTFMCKEAIARGDKGAIRIYC